MSEPKTITYTPVWNDGKPRPTVTLKVASMERKQGWVRGKTTDGVTFGPIPETWVNSSAQS